MNKLADGDVAARGSLTAAPAYAVQFFLIPLAVVAVTVAVYLGFRSLVADQRTAGAYLAEIQNGSVSDRWPAAYELSRLMADPEVANDPLLGAAVVKAFRASMGSEAAGWCGLAPCPPVRRYLALAVGRLRRPLPGDAVPALTDALADSDPETVINAIWALGSLGDPSVVPRLEAMFASTDAGIRKITVYALGALPGESQRRLLATALNDPAPDVQWNAAVALAMHGDREGLPVLRRMLDRPYVESTVRRGVGPGTDEDPVADVMVGALSAVAALKEASLHDEIAALSRTDASLRVRQAALEALKTR